MRYVDFDDELHRSYVAGRRLGPGVLEMWMTALATLLDGAPVTRALDLGAGTGRFTSALGTSLGADVVAVDPSRNMLARMEGDAPRVVAPAESLPFDDGSFDLVFASMVIHHFESVDAAAREVARVLEPGASFVVRTCFSDTLEAPYHRFFPTVLELERELLPTLSDFVHTLGRRGIAMRARRRLRQRMDANLRDYADRIRRRAMSPLLLISDERFAQGMEMLDAAAARERDPQPLFESIDLLRFTTEPAGA